MIVLLKASYKENMWVDDFRTDYKYKKSVLAPSGAEGVYDKSAVDCPFVFYHNSQYYMLHVGFDGKGYQTALATSDDLMNWKKETLIFPRGTGTGWDKAGIAGVWILKNNNLHETPVLKKVNGKYWMVYHSYPEEGYEQGAAEIGLAYTDDETLHNWTTLSKPILSWKDGDAWEQGGLYKGCMIEHQGKFYMFYNAKNKSKWVWNEQIGMAVSNNMIDWERIQDNPVIRNTISGWDAKFCADPYVVWDGEKWIMFYYGYDGVHAKEGIAFSDDLYHWEKYSKPIISNGQIGDIDELHAHKPCVIEKDGILYHFYCSVRNYIPSDTAFNIDPTQSDSTNAMEYRCITVATNKAYNPENSHSLSK